MAITSVTQTRFRDTTLVMATSDLVGSRYFYWYVEGAFIGETRVGQRQFVVERGEQLVVDVIDSAVKIATPAAQALAADQFPARRTIQVVQSLDFEADHYLVRLYEV